MSPEIELDSSGERNEETDVVLGDEGGGGLVLGADVSWWDADEDFDYSDYNLGAEMSASEFWEIDKDYDVGFYKSLSVNDADRNNLMPGENQKPEIPTKSSSLETVAMVSPVQKVQKMMAMVTPPGVNVAPASIRYPAMFGPYAVRSGPYSTPNQAQQDQRGRIGGIPLNTVVPPLSQYVVPGQQALQSVDSFGRYVAPWQRQSDWRATPQSMWQPMNTNAMNARSAPSQSAGPYFGGNARAAPRQTFVTSARASAAGPDVVGSPSPPQQTNSTITTQPPSSNTLTQIVARGNIATELAARNVPTEPSRSNASSKLMAQPRASIEATKSLFGRNLIRIG
jgi:hypothetical protein